MHCSFISLDFFICVLNMTNHRGINFCVLLSCSVNNLSRLTLFVGKNWFLLRLLRLTNVLFQLGRYKSKFILHRIFILCRLNWTKYPEISVRSRTAWCGLLSLRNKPCWKLCMWLIACHVTADLKMYPYALLPLSVIPSFSWTLFGWQNR